MSSKELSREELFALVWEQPTSEIAKQLGISDVAVGKLCAKLQVPKPPRGYWARRKAGQRIRRPALVAFRQELEEKRLASIRARSSEVLTPLQRQFYDIALSEIARRRDKDSDEKDVARNRISELDGDTAAQILLLVQGNAQLWVEQGRVAAFWGTALRNTIGRLVERLLPVAKPQLLVLETEATKGTYRAEGPVVFLRMTQPLQERIARAVHLVRSEEFDHIVMPLSAVDHAWTAKNLYEPASQMFLNSQICVSGQEIWVEWFQRSFRDEAPLERHSTNHMRIRDIIPIDFLTGDERVVRPSISAARVKPYADRLRAVQEAERVSEMLSRAAYSVDRSIPSEILGMADRIWFGDARPFQTAREALSHIENELERWDEQLEVERRLLAQSILEVAPGDIVVSDERGRLQRLSVTSVSLYCTESGVNFTISGLRFRKDGTIGKLQGIIYFSFGQDELTGQAKSS